MKIAIPVLSKKTINAALQLNPARSAFADPVDDKDRKPSKPPPPEYGAGDTSNVGTG